MKTPENTDFLSADHSLSDFYDLGAVAHYHNQPPFETPARTWLSARSITGKTTVDELLRWADQHGIANMDRLEITFTRKPTP
jgi:hypothetical protein